MESYIDYSHHLPNSEYTNENQILTGAPELIPIYSVLLNHQYINSEATRKNIADLYNSCCLLGMINDLRRIQAYYNEKPLECVKYISDKYIDSDKYGHLSDVFILCLKSLITNNIIAKNSTFNILLNPKIKLRYLSDDDVAKISNNLDEAYKLSTPIATSSADNTNEVKLYSKKEQKTFRDYLLCENADEVMIKLHELLENEKSGAKVAIVLAALKERGYLPNNCRIASLMIREFNIICSNQAITGYKKLLEKDIKVMANELP